MAQTHKPTERGGREVENENLRRPDQDGKPPRPATEPKGAKTSSISTETETDPGSGEPNPHDKA